MSSAPQGVVDSPVVPPGTVVEEAQHLAGLAWPVVLAQVGMVAMGVVDLFVAGQLGAVSMGAIGVGHTLGFAAMVPAMGTASGVDPIVAQAYGAGTPRVAGAAALKCAGLVGVLLVVTLAAHLAATPLLTLLQQDPLLIPEASRYLWITAVGMPAFMGFLVIKQLLQGNGIMRPAMYAVVVANVVNLVLDIGLGLGRFGLPKLGVDGIAWATVGVRWSMLVVLAIVAIPHVRRAWPTAVERAQVSWSQVAGTALPVGLHSSVEAWAFVVAGLVAGTLGAVEAAAHAGAMNVASLTFMVPLGIGAAAATRVGNLVGAKMSWVRSGWVAVGLGASVMAISAVCFATWPAQIASLYSPDAAVVAAMATLLPLAAVFQGFDGTQAVSFGVLRGVGDTRVPSAIALVAFWLVSVPLQLWLAYGLGWGLTGVWTGLVAGLSCVAVLLVGRIAVFSRRVVEPA